MTKEEEKLIDTLKSLGSSVESIGDFSEDSNAFLTVAAVGNYFTGTVKGNAPAIITLLCALIQHDDRFREFFEIAIEFYDAHHEAVEKIVKKNAIKFKGVVN